MDKRVQFSTFLRSFLIQGGWNFEGMQNLGFMYAIGPAMRRIYSEKELPAAMHRHIEMFNTQPFMVGFALGLVIKMEENAAALPSDQREAAYRHISLVKKALGSATAAIGDRLFWGTVRAIGFLILLLIWWLGGFSRWTAAPWELSQSYFDAYAMVIVVGGLAGMVLYNLMPLWIRWSGIAYGYQCESNQSCGLDYMNWQQMIRNSRRLGFWLVIIVSALYFYTMVELSLRKHGLSAGFVLSVGLAAVSAGCAIWLRRRGFNIIYFYLAIVGLAGLAYSLV